MKDSINLKMERINDNLITLHNNSLFNLLIQVIKY